MKKIPLLLCMLSVPIIVRAQESQFSQYFSSGAIMNPAFIGTLSSINFNTNYKQVNSLEDETYVELTQSTISYPLKRVTTREEYIGSAGISFFRERRGFQGAYRNQKVLMNGAYSISLSDLSNKFLIFGLQGGFAQQEITSDGFKWGAQYNQFWGYDNSINSGENFDVSPIRYGFFNFGMIFSTFDNIDRYVRNYSFSAGISADNINRPNTGLISSGNSRKSILWKAFTSFQFPLGPRFKGYPSVYVLNSNGSTQMNVGMNVSTFVSSARSKLGVEIQTGVWYRWQDAIVALIGFNFNSYQIGFSVDFNTENFGFDQSQSNQFAAYEVSLGMNLQLSKHYRRVSTPIF